MTSPLPDRWNDRDEIEDVIGGVLVSHIGYPDHQNIVRCDCGGSEREAFAEHLRRVLTEAILAAGFRRSVVSTPSDEARALENLQAQVRAASRQMERDAAWLIRWVEEAEGGGVDADDLARLREFVDGSAVSAPPTITDEAGLLELVRSALQCYDAWANDLNGGTTANEDRMAVALRAVRAALGGEA